VDGVSRTAGLSRRLGIPLVGIASMPALAEILRAFWKS
jgi:hypothetical protein